MRRQVSSIVKVARVPVVALCLGFLVILYVWLEALAQAQASRNLDKVSFEISEAGAQIRFLHDAAARVVARDESIDQARFATIMDKIMDFASARGLRAVALTRKMTAEDVADRVAVLNASPSSARFQGLDFEIAPQGQRDVYYPAVMVVPEAGNERVYGFDLWADDERRLAARRAILTGDMIASRPVTLSQDQDQDRASLLLITPVRSTLEGDGLPRWLVASGFTVTQSLSGFTAATIDGGERILVADIGPAEASGSEAPISLLSIGSSLSGGVMTISASRDLVFFGRSWRIVSTVDLAGRLGQPLLVAFALVVIVLVLALTTAASLLSLAESRRALQAEVSRQEVDLRETNERLIAALRRAESAAVAKDRFIAHLSHDLRTPLNAIAGFAAILSGRHLAVPASVPQSRVREYADHIEGSAKRLKGLIDRLLDFASVSQDDETPTLVRADPGPIVAQVVGEVRAAHRDCRLRVENQLPPETLIHTDPGQFAQALSNVLSNAAKYAASAGRILVRLVPDDTGAVRITVRDRGPGLPPSVLGQLGRPFHRGDHPYRAGADGFGLGLAVTMSVCRRLGIELDIANRRRGGVRVTFRVPTAAGSMP